MSESLPFDEMLVDQTQAEKTRQRRPGMRAAFRHLPRILPYLKRFWYLMALAIMFTILSALLGIAEPWPLAFLVDNVLGRHPVPGWVENFFGTSTVKLILVAVFSGLGIAFLTNSTHVVNEYVKTKLAERMVLEFRSDLFHHVQQLSLGFHNERRKGSLMYAVNSQAKTMGQITVALLPLAEGVIRLMGMFFVAYGIDSQLALLSLTVVPFIYYSTGWYGKHIDPELRRVRGMESMSMAIVYEAMSMLRVILAFGREDHEYRRFRGQGEHAVDARVKLTVRQTGFSLVVNIITAAGTALVLWFGARHVLSRELTVGQLIIIMSYIASVYKPLEQISTTFANLQEQLISLEAAINLLEAPPEVVSPPDGIAIERARGEVVFEGVDFSYKGRVGTLKDISFRAPAGSVVALVGPTGAGKSTLVGLIPRFMDPSKGRILIDGVDVRQMTLDSLRAQISLVLQEPLLFSGTIKENIRYGRLEATNDDIRQAGIAAGAHDFIMKLPKRYNTILGEGGAQLSGGERQRICIARAFVRDAPILILDEPTSAVDSRTEAAILEALNRLMVGRTTFLIAHRLGTIRGADKVLVMNDGELLQQGSREELAATEGLFRELSVAQGVGVPEILTGDGPQASPSGESKELAATQNGKSAVTQARPAAGKPEGRVPSGDGGLRPATPPIAASRRGDAQPSPLQGPANRRAAGYPSQRPKVVLLGMASKFPVAGVLWQTIHYLVGFERLGFDAYYVEAHARTPSMLMTGERDDAALLAARLIQRMMARVDLDDRWAFHALHQDGRCLGMPYSDLKGLYQDAALIFNLHGGTIPTEEHSAGGRLIYLETDPVEVQIQLHDKSKETIEFLKPHSAVFTFAENYGNPSCLLPVSRQFEFLPTRQPVVLDYWRPGPGHVEAYRTVGNWKQAWRDLVFKDEIYRWSKHHEFLKYLGIPGRSSEQFELAMAGLDQEDRGTLEAHGWRVRGAHEISQDLDVYRDYISASKAEFTVAKDQNVRLRTGWFSDRSATYLACGRPVVTQETGFSDVLPTGKGLFAFSNPEEAIEAVKAIGSDYPANSKAATEIAREHFSHEVVLGDLLDHLGIRSARPRCHDGAAAGPFRASLDLMPVSRRPLRHSEETVNAVVSSPPARRLGAAAEGRPKASVVVVVHSELATVRLCLDSLLYHTLEPSYELILVDNAAGEETSRYLRTLEESHPGIRLLRNDHNRGFAAAVNQGTEVASGMMLVILNDDTIPPGGWLAGICRHLDDPRVGAVTPVTNRSEDEAEIPVSYQTYYEFLTFAERRARRYRGRLRKARTLSMFCFALRTGTYRRIGPLDEGYGQGLFEDDDYCWRMRQAGYVLGTAEDVLVHHFGGASFGSLVPDGRYARLFAENRRRFEQKWTTVWKPHSRRPDPGYRRTTERLQELVSEQIPAGDRVAVVSRGDEALLKLPGRPAQHFPQAEDGTYTGFYPVDSTEAVAHLEQLRDRGTGWLVIPKPAFWWLDHYEDFSRHLESSYRQAVVDDECLIFSLRKSNRQNISERSDAAEPGSSR